MKTRREKILEISYPGSWLRGLKILWGSTSGFILGAYQAPCWVIVILLWQPMYASYYITSKFKISIDSDH